MILLAVLAVSCSERKELAPVPAAADLSEHPVYSKYELGKTENIIDVGMQPLWVPTCIISETMKRGAVLVEELAEQDLEIRFHGFLKGADVNFFLERGDLEAGIGGDMPALTAAAGSGVLVAALTQLGFCFNRGEEAHVTQGTTGQAHCLRLRFQRTLCIVDGPPTRT